MKINKIHSHIPFKNSTFKIFEQHNKPISTSKINQTTQTKPHVNTKNYLPLKIAGGILALGALSFGIYKVIKKPSKSINKIPEYINELAQGLSIETGQKVNPSQLSSVMTKKELLSALSELSETNYIASDFNIASGLFRADLHSHSNLSDGTASVETIMEQVASYANDLFSETKQKFIFALTDHDNVDGVKKALKIIADDPEKYKNVRFVPAVELSFAHIADKSHNTCEMPEVLAYCVNPFSKNIQDYFSGLKQKRLTMVSNFINDLKKAFPDVNFNIDEFDKHYNPQSCLIKNCHWRVFHYGQIKKAATEASKSKGISPDELSAKIGDKLGFEKTLYHAQSKGLLPKTIQEDKTIKTICEKYAPQIAPSGTLILPSEASFEEIIKTFSNEKDTFLAFAHPYYLSEMVENVSQTASDLVSKSKGLLIGTEAFHQAYKEPISVSSVKNINDIMDSIGIKIKLGGRDNHMPDWLKI